MLHSLFNLTVLAESYGEAEGLVVGGVEGVGLGLGLELHVPARQHVDPQVGVRLTNQVCIFQVLKVEIKIFKENLGIALGIFVIL